MTKVTEEQAKEIAVQQVGNVKELGLSKKMKKYICNRNREKCK